MQMQLQHAHESARMCHFADNLKLSVGVGCGPLKLNDLEIGVKFGSPIPVPRNVFLKKVKFRKVLVEREESLDAENTKCLHSRMENLQNCKRSETLVRK